MDPALTVIPQVPPSTPVAGDAANAPVGIHCANPDCRTRAGERSRGHQSCRALLCGHCCQNAARQAAEAGEPRPICKVHSRRVHTGHKPILKDQQHQPASQTLSLHPPVPPNRELSSDGGGGAGPSSTPTWTIPTTNSNMNGNLGVAEDDTLNELLERRSQLEQSLKRSVTVVVWYRNGLEPLRLAHEVTTFPLFRLQDFGELVSEPELNLSPASYIDGYNPDTGLWEQIKLATVRTVEQDQRLLFRIRPRMLESLSDCPSLDQELALQPSPQQQQLKRSAPDADSPLQTPNKQARVISNSVPVRPPAPSMTVQTQTHTPTPSTPSTSTASVTRIASSWAPIHGTPAPVSSGVPPPVPPNATTSTSWDFVPSGTIPVVNRTSHPKSGAPNSAGPSPAGPASGSQHTLSLSGPRRWPTDFSVYEITNGFLMIANILASDPRERQKTAFERVFPGCRYVKSTVGRAKLYWKRASPEIRDHFLALDSRDDRGRWVNFVHLMDGRLIIEVGGGTSLVGASNGHRVEEGADGHGSGQEGEDGQDEREHSEEVEGGNGALAFSPDQMHQGQLPAHMGMNHSQLPGAPDTPEDPSRSPLIQPQTDPALLAHQHPHAHTHHSHPAHPMSMNDVLRQQQTMGPATSLSSAMPQQQQYSDRGLNINRSSSSLSGAMAIPNQ
ncbi:hypothetical protein SCHPADRAFT_997049 [Schizopora paradoxa]|uniref:Uncharacterized protein n=1 Tax=Schizopora paradoxa TaxID=27342 RepID=A0A0H2SAE1_9AGAM|nr:hypothetical protein SCHPADRAFT_997049 [Schizopora paradoxa]